MRKSWKKQWINELDERVPTLRDDILNAPISIADTPETQKVESRIKTENDGGKAEKTCVKKGWSFTDKLNLWVERFCLILNLLIMSLKTAKFRQLKLLICKLMRV